MKWVKAVPDELTSAMRIMHFPSIPAIPPTLRGMSAIVIMACYNGEERVGEALLQPMRTVGDATARYVCPDPLFAGRHDLQ